ncbi:hypothetical protein MAR_037986 [Mya arenaria]|uniref:Uncharacterized protein n=1 Tax=Mya arenaria TaxID=6604 RepID=A0ABY7FRV4_MYAAR|nr:hypothetical protein MAR_037986 [Mya arenaria]
MESLNISKRKLFGGPDEVAAGIKSALPSLCKYSNQIKKRHDKTSEHRHITWFDVFRRNESFKPSVSTIGIFPICDRLTFEQVKVSFLRSALPSLREYSKNQMKKRQDKTKTGSGDSTGNVNKHLQLEFPVLLFTIFH